MKLLPSLLLFTVAVYACDGNYAYRCKKQDGTVPGDYSVTKRICDKMDKDLCYCWRTAEDHCGLSTYSEAKKFKEKCRGVGLDWFPQVC